MKMNRLIETTLVASLMLIGVVGCDVVAEKGDKTQYDDGALSERVRTSFARDPLLRPDTILVSSSSGVVLISGNVGSLDERQRATALANMVPGVQSVENDLVVK
jgi:osmotically-inducible protein OsmY